MNLFNFTQIGNIGLLENIVIWLLFGLVVGLIANIISPFPTALGIIGTILLGMVGAALGGLIGNLVFAETVTGFNLVSLALAVGGALLVLLIVKGLSTTKERHIKTRITKVD